MIFLTIKTLEWTVRLTLMMFKWSFIVTAWSMKLMWQMMLLPLIGFMASGLSVISTSRSVKRTRGQQGANLAG
ncbi:hypothetical protein [Kocuria rosea]|uniref:hypothetical protein n=1 Tax=Kocuria rosea TaxID=1275 RepID=UPI000F6C032C|nr:hypothetical protein [Kocuria rosea]MEB2527270.1 hypothetical protein [Kocuria rosea]MEB2617337.1 hypothetical protein [Kocuria rosea]VEH41633.1 Uncharacterised protein [Kocuria rosea]